MDTLYQLPLKTHIVIWEKMMASQDISVKKNLVKEKQEGEGESEPVSIER